ncbi:hypothetical protein D4764_06G0008190 [Takifugu flavidus]|uniref:Uncharacterized protein n=1 Tax=Takifugu flavidus TaxID=433684 RepID=A0A5C6MWV6_9TELE|nr:hypothetical protein D4764_06G0008190 [Takifugu flavidus]
MVKALPEVCPASFPTIGANSLPGGDQLTAPPFSSPECPEHAAANPMTQPQSTELGSTYPCPSPLTIGNSSVVESPTPLEKTGSRALAGVNSQFMQPGIRPPRSLPSAATQNRMHPTPLAPSEGGEPTGRGSHVASSGFARPDSMGRGPATRRSPTCPTPRPGSRRGQQ